MFTSLIIPDATLEAMRWLNELEQRSAASETAMSLLELTGKTHVVDLPPRPSLPVLLLHSRGDARVPFQQGQTLARSIADDRFVPPESKNHLILPHEPTLERVVREVDAFLDEDPCVQP